MRAGAWWPSLMGLLGLLALLAGAAVAAPEALDDRGRPLPLEAPPPQRIVSLLPSLTETVCALDACGRLVGVDRFSNWPESVRRLPQVGGLEDAQIERIVALRPDLVLAAASSRAVERLEGLGLRVVVLEPRTHDSARRTMETVARLLGRPGAGQALWARVDQRIGAAAARVPPALRGQRVYFEVGSGPYAAGESSFVGETLQRLGLGNVVPASLGPFPKLNPEYIVRARPDIVMAPRASLDELPRRPGWSAVPAVAGRRWCGFDPQVYDVLVRPGPRLGEAAEQMAGCLQALAGRAP
ncbi:ABC transporter substrate-binding protein [Aquincola sp. J276]|uniref:ABC transporter substrate-binding protein n=1 Tax=Aquincola sp. J276 TaxID=2898432 RepID=UPI0021506E95|nr:helical backbone metal receptor [Aquincola sp. J276]MCR5864302.1 helical backbone metal receptor [Aquincola sp. J276]